MKEQDVRQRIESFLKRTAREMIIPASVGLGLALTGCSDVPTLYPPYGVGPMPDASAQEVGLRDVSIDAAVPDAGVDAVAPDAGVDAEMIDGETD
jgi:hypothetical protein